MSETPTVPPYVNQAMKFMLALARARDGEQNGHADQLPGRKSGKLYTTPVSYSQNGEWCTFSPMQTGGKICATWAPVTCASGQGLQGLADPVAEDKQAVAAGLSDAPAQGAE